ASATSTSVTGTPSRSAIASSSLRSGPAGSEWTLLNSGSTATGYTNDAPTTSRNPPAPTPDHQQRGERRISRYSSASATVQITQVTPSDLSWSVSHDGHDWVDSP